MGAVQGSDWGTEKYKGPIVELMGFFLLIRKKVFSIYVYMLTSSENNLQQLLLQVISAVARYEGAVCNGTIMALVVISNF